MTIPDISGIDLSAIGIDPAEVERLAKQFLGGAVADPEPKAPAKAPASEPARAGGDVICPVDGCGKDFDAPFRAVNHLRAKHAWDDDAITAWKDAQPKRVTGRITPDTAGASRSSSDFSGRLQGIPKVQHTLMTGGNQLLLQGLMLLGWFPPHLLVQFKSVPELPGIPIPQLDRPTEFGAFLLLDDKEAWVYAAAWSLSEGTPLMRLLERHGLIFAQAGAAIAVALVTLAHLRKVWALRDHPSVLEARRQQEEIFAQFQEAARAAA